MKSTALFFLLAISISAAANAQQVLFSAPDGRQYKVDLGPGGFVGSANTVIWDESIDGAMPAAADYEVVRRSGKTLVVDQAKVDAKNARIAAASAAKAAEKQDADDLIALKAKLADDTATLADLRKILKILVKRSN